MFAELVGVCLISCLSVLCSLFLDLVCSLQYRKLHGVSFNLFSVCQSLLGGWGSVQEKRVDGRRGPTISDMRMHWTLHRWELIRPLGCKLGVWWGGYSIYVTECELSDAGKGNESPDLLPRGGHSERGRAHREVNPYHPSLESSFS